ncbi:helix-turn-helix domain-containing protein [Croceicoccus gelatinilyticus]|uniref:helix-turn-helix domain-containing protein n=1 Tax=Croceicoccus gelatinilyticus TaxID=2835536 RepID=UPI003B58A335
MTVVAMSHGELSRFDTLMRVERGEFRIDDAVVNLALKRRQIFRPLERLRAEGAPGLISRKRGRPSNRRYSDALREHYHDFGPTLAREYIIERHGTTVACNFFGR